MVHVYALTIRDVPHERCIGVDIDAALFGDRVLVGGRGQTKVTNLNVTRRVEEDIAWLQVSMNHTLFRESESDIKAYIDRMCMAYSALVRITGNYVLAK